MKVSATDMKNNLGKYIKFCREEEVYITKNDRIVAKLSGFDNSEKGYLLFRDGEAAYNYTGKKVTYEEFLNLTEGTEERYEYIDGEIFLLDSPGFAHQMIQSNLLKNFFSWFEGKKCVVLSAPFDITLTNSAFQSKNVVQPDILVACDHNETINEKDKYMGVPSMVIEIISKKTRNRDLVKKLNVYLDGGVNEYWVVDPKKRQVVQYYFENRNIEQVMTYKESETIRSVHFKGLDMAVADMVRIQ